MRIDDAIQSGVDAVVHFAMDVFSVDKSGVLYGLLAATTASLIGCFATGEGWHRLTSLMCALMYVSGVHAQTASDRSGANDSATAAACDQGCLSGHCLLRRYRVTDGWNI